MSVQSVTPVLNVSSAWKPNDRHPRLDRVRHGAARRVEAGRSLTVAVWCLQGMP